MMYKKIIRIMDGIISTCLMILLILFIASASVANDVDTQIRQKSNELNILKRQKQEYENKKRIAMEAERSVLQSLRSIDRELTKREKELRIYDDKLKKETSRLKAVQFRVNALDFQSNQQKSTMNNRLRNFYKLSYQSSYLDSLNDNLNSIGIFKIKKCHERLMEKQYFNSIISSDQGYLERLKAERALLYDTKNKLERDKKLILAYTGKISQEKSKILRDKSNRQVLLVEYRNQKEAYTRTLEQLERSVVQLENLIAKLRSTSKPSNQLELQLSTLSLDELGVLSWPVLGRVIANAIPELPGITIQANYGDSVKSISDGIVEYAGWFDAIGFGQMIIINHGHNYMSIYAHLSEILVKKGNRVKRDQAIGKVGDIGGSGRSALYFEIRRGPYPVNARRWLR